MAIRAIQDQGDEKQCEAGLPELSARVGDKEERKDLDWNPYCRGLVRAEAHVQ